MAPDRALAAWRHALGVHLASADVHEAAAVRFDACDRPDRAAVARQRAARERELYATAVEQHPERDLT